MGIGYYGFCWGLVEDWEIITTDDDALKLIANRTICGFKAAVY